MPPAPASSPRVVLGDDGSTGSDIAWLWVTSQSWPGFALDVLTAVPPPLGPVTETADAVPRPIEGPAPRHAPAEAGFGTVQFLEVSADPRIALAARTDATLVVVGPASEGLGPWHIGSTAEWLLNSLPAPLVIARRGRPARAALLCADGSPHAAAAAAAFVALPWASATSIAVIGVDDGRTDVDAATEAVMKILVDAGLDAEVVHASGRPHRAILEEADARTADLVVLGTRGTTMLRRLTVGSTASAVVRSARASVLVAQAP